LREAHPGDATGHRVSVRSVRSHGIVGISNGDDSRKQRDIGTTEPVWISTAVHPFMVMANDLGDLSVVSHVRQDSLADCGVLFHLPSLIQREGTRLLQETHGQPDLPDVMDETAKMHELLLIRC